ncbi:DUF1177 domain-containing protein [Natrialba sp. PRR66]|uniref:DUF1177 domain-containing protein n=1 Tax=Natrialba sp. PRR66 TaxID=3098146 RepID=UPI002B1DF89A|nr:DUF1177 domain-containing protein [Natrialba sp. PRR66]
MMKNISTAHELLDEPEADGATIADALESNGVTTDVETIDGEDGQTDFITTRIPGNGSGPTLGIVGRLGGVGARPAQLGTVSDADGAIVAVATALSLSEMYAKGDQLSGDVLISTHICPNAPTQPHEPVPFMGSPVDIETMNDHEIDDEMDAVLSVDATKGNRIHCSRGFAVTPTVKEGWILRVSEDLLDVQERVTGEPPETLTLTMQDITPYGNDIHHINSILQPATATDIPVTGVATTSTNPVAGSATGANYLPELSATTQFVVEAAKDYTGERLSFYDDEEFDRLIALYGSMSKLQTIPTIERVR